jgi:phosphoenolpyruvate carboxykinase (ATP)
VNTGWVGGAAGGAASGAAGGAASGAAGSAPGGAAGVGHRMDLKYTRAMVSAVVDGKLDAVATQPHPVFEVGVPVECPGVPAEILDARRQWADGAAYDLAAQGLEGRFRKNFEKFGEAEKPFLVSRF